MAQSLSPFHEPTDTTESLKSKRRFSPILLVPLGLVLAGIGASTWYFLLRPPTTSLRLSGRIEGYETDIGPKVAGRVNAVAVREGDAVRKGQVIVQMDDAEIQAQLKGATARLLSTQQQELQARLQINVLESQIQEQELSLQQSQGDAKGRIFQAEGSVASSIAQFNQAEAQLQQAKSELKLAKTNRDRFATLLKQGAVTQQQFDQVQTTFETTQATVQSRQASLNSFRKLVDSAQGQLLQAQSTAFNPGMRNAQLAGLHTQLAQSKLKLAAAQADVNNAKAAQQEIQSKSSDLNIFSPIDGVVTTRNVEPGAVVTSGKTLLTIINPNNVYLRGFVPEGNLQQVKIGQKAKVFLDSAPNKPLSATVAAIDTQASFTPENIYFQKDRVKQVFGVKISINNPAGFAKPGMPADAEIITEPEAKK